jgi:hypothetical protein
VYLISIYMKFDILFVTTVMEDTPYVHVRYCNSNQCKLSLSIYLSLLK